MKYIIIPGCLLVSVFLQTTLLNAVAVKGMGVNLFLCVTVLLMLIMDEPILTMAAAALVGIIYDVCFSQYTGITSVAILLTGFGIYYITHVVNIQNRGPVLAATAAATVLYNLIVWLIYHMLGAPFGFFYMMSLQVFYIAYNWAAIAGLHYVVTRIGEKHETHF